MKLFFQTLFFGFTSWGQYIEISERITPGWAILAKRWIVERTFAWLNHFRRLAKDYEIAVKSVENLVIIAHSIVLIKRCSL